MSVTYVRALLLISLALLAFATWINETALADAMLIFAAFSIGGIWSKYSSAGLRERELLQS